MYEDQELNDDYILSLKAEKTYNPRRPQDGELHAVSVIRLGRGGSSSHL